MSEVTCVVRETETVLMGAMFHIVELSDGRRVVPFADLKQVFENMIGYKPADTADLINTAMSAP